MCQGSLERKGNANVYHHAGGRKRQDDTSWIQAVGMISLRMKKVDRMDMDMYGHGHVR